MLNTQPHIWPNNSYQSTIPVCTSTAMTTKSFKNLTVPGACKLSKLPLLSKTNYLSLSHSKAASFLKNSVLPLFTFQPLFLGHGMHTHTQKRDKKEIKQLKKNGFGTFETNQLSPRDLLFFTGFYTLICSLLHHKSTGWIKSRITGYRK